MSEPMLNDVDQVDIRHRLGADVRFDLEIMDESTPPVPIQVVAVTRFVVLDRRGVELADWLAHAVIADAPDDHIIAVNVDKTVADLIPRGTRHDWRLGFTTAAGEDKVLWGNYEAVT